MAAAVLALATAGSPEAVELAGALALLVAACFLFACLLKLGWLADYLSRPVLVGYIHGVAVVLVVGELRKLTGIDVEGDGCRPRCSVAIVLAAGLSMIDDDARVTPGVVVYRLDDRLFFANGSYVKGRVHEALRGASTVTTALVPLHFARAKYLIRPGHRACNRCPLPRHGPRGRARRGGHHPVGVMPAACAAVTLRG